LQQWLTSTTIYASNYSVDMGVAVAVTVAVAVAVTETVTVAGDW